MIGVHMAQILPLLNRSVKKNRNLQSKLDARKLIDLTLIREENTITNYQELTQWIAEVLKPYVQEKIIVDSGELRFQLPHGKCVVDIKFFHKSNYES